MSNLQIKDGAGSDKYLKASGAGTNGDAHVPEHLETNSAAILAAVDGVETLIAATNTALATIDGRVDGLESLVASTNTKLDTVNTNLSTIDVRVDGVETLIAATNTALATIDGRVDGVEGLIGSTNTKLDTVNTNLTTIDGRVDGVETLISSTNTKLDSVLAALFGRQSLVNTSVTRPANTTAYAAKDVLSDSTSAPTVLTFANVAYANGGSGLIVKARLQSNRSTDTARIRLHLYHTAPTAINDNDAFTLLWANRDKRIGYIDFPALATEGSGSDSVEAIVTPGATAPGLVPLQFTCAAGNRTLYGILETLDAFTPASGQVFFVELASALE